MRVMKNTIKHLLALGTLFAVALTATASPTPAVSLRVELDRDVLPAKTTDKTVLKIALNALQLPRTKTRPPVNLTLVLDRSSSMRGERIEQAKAAALEALNILAPDDILSLVVYDSNASVLIPAQRVGNGRKIADAIRSISVTGMTALHAGVVLGADELRKNIEDPRYIHRLILLSDGQANRGPRTPAELGQLGRQLGSEGISVTTIGLGLSYNEELMSRLAETSDGNTYFVEAAADLPNIFAAELGDVLSITARRVSIEIEFPEGVRPIRFVGRDGSVSGQRARLNINQLYGGQEKYALIEIETPDRDANTEHEIARATVTYEDTRSQKTETLNASRRARFSADREVVVKSANLKVQEEYADNYLAVAKDEALTLSAQGQHAPAAALLSKSSADMSSYGGAYYNNGVLRSAKSAEVVSETIATGRLSERETKKIRADSTQLKNQQTTTNKLDNNSGSK